MADQRDGGIAWTDATWNPVRGCSRVSEGCRNCYAERVAVRFSGPGQPYEGLAYGGPRHPETGRVQTGRRGHWTGKVRLVPEHLADPLRWKRPRRVFVNSMSDLFHERLTNEEIAYVFGVMAAAKQHTFQVLTKRPERMVEWFRWVEASKTDEYASVFIQRLAHNRIEYGSRWPLHSVKGTYLCHPWPLPNVWLGVSVEDQYTAETRVPDLLEVSAVVHFVSYEPALGHVLLSDLRDTGGGPAWIDALNGVTACPGWGDGIGDHPQKTDKKLSWVIVGGESGAGARPFRVEWARSVVEQCKAAGVACFVKQLGAYPIESPDYFCEWTNHGVSIVQHGAERGRIIANNSKAGDPAEWPADLRVRQFPEVSR